MALALFLYCVFVAMACFKWLYSALEALYGVLFYLPISVYLLGLFCKIFPIFFLGGVGFFLFVFGFCLYILYIRRFEYVILHYWYGCSSFCLLRLILALWCKI
jgi:hypothetical protein